MDGNMTPLLDGLTLQAGFSWYEERRVFTDMEENNTQLYLSVTYQFKGKFANNYKNTLAFKILKAKVIILI
jgi:hypothetical protein